MRIAIVTDAWPPQVNGVVTTLQRTVATLETLGHEVRVLSANGHVTIPCPTYPEIRLALWPRRRLAAELDSFAPDAIHVATEGPLGMAAARHCTARGLEFTTSYHTQFPQYVRKRVPIPEKLTYALLRRHHSQARRTLVATEQQRRELVANGFRNMVLWSRGVDTELFRPRGRQHLPHARPIFAYLGRVAVEKNVRAFLDLDLPGTQVVIGDGPDRTLLESCYPFAVFLGFKFGVELAQALSSADVLVFPSRTDTFGLVMLEAMASGTPVAAYPVTGPIDVVAPGVLDADLRKAALAALARAAGAWRALGPGSARVRSSWGTSCALATATISRHRPRAERYARMPFGVWRSQGSTCGSWRCAAALRSSVKAAVGRRTGACHQRVVRPASGVLSLRSTRSTLLTTARASCARSMTKRFQYGELCATGSYVEQPVRALRHVARDSVPQE